MKPESEKEQSIEIIDNPSLRSVLRTIGEWSFTTAMWVLWVYLFFPIINIILWVLGIRQFYLKVIADSDYLQLIELSRNCGWAVIGIFLVLWCWGKYNYHRFGKKNRRSDQAPVSLEELAIFFDVPVGQVLAMRGQKEISWTTLYIPKNDLPREKEM